MQKCFTTLFLLFLFISASNAQKSNEQFSSNNQEEFYLYAASIEDISMNTAVMQDDDNILLTERKRIRIINLGPVVNWKGLDYAPTISADGRTLYYVSNRPGSKLNEKGEPSHDFWAAKKNDRLDTIFFEPFNIDTTTLLGDLGVNTRLNEGAASIAADRQSLYFTACNRPDGFGDCDIYMTTIEGDKWGRPVNLGPNVNSAAFDSQPSIAPDKSRIYFISTRKGPNSNGEGKKENFDIWYSDYDFDKDEWQPAKNLEELNTKGQEASPFIAADNTTLFFASNGYPDKIGGLDFYFSRFEDGKWNKPVNLGEPINTKQDEYFITLPAAGDILYFSSNRKDLPGYQGDLDIFMAFVPTFFRAINLKIYVIDECSGQNIPSLVTVKNPITNRVVSEELTMDRVELQMVVSNTDYGDPKADHKFVDLEITAENPKYGKVSKTQRVYKPSITKKVEETEVFADIIYDTLMLGQKPVLSATMDEASYVTRNKATNPKLANFRGLVMEQFQTWDLYPLLNYVFFDLGSSEIPKRYILFPSKDRTVGFTDTTIAGGTLDKYYHILNIYGYRLTKFPDAKIEIVGCNDGTLPEEKRPGLSKERATNVFNYLKNVWQIDESRMKLTFRDKPEVISNLKDSLGIVENRRVEIRSNDWNIMKPVFDKDPKTFPQPEEMTFKMKNGIEDALVTKRRIVVNRDGKNWNTLTDVGTTKETYIWDWTNPDGGYPKDDKPYVAKLVVTTGSGRECESDPITIPVMQVSTLEKLVQKQNDSTIERYSLILFPFDKFIAGPINDRIMNDYVYDRVKPTSVVEVIGHTDIVGLYEHNQKLSENRSRTVYEGIMKKTGGKFAILNRRGVGEDEPLYSNDLPEGRFYNRTVQVLIKTPIVGEE